MNPWIIVKTDMMRENRVAAAFNAAGIETYLPMDVRSKAVTRHGPRHTKRRIISETPLIPCSVFAHCRIEALPDVKHVRRVLCDVLGLPLVIPGPQMVRFMATHSEWLEGQRKAHAAGKPGKVVKSKFKAMDEDVLRDIAKALFGVEIDVETGELAA